MDPVLVTGAFGQIGKRCTEILLSRGRTVIATDLRNDASAAAAEELAGQGQPGHLVTVYADLLDGDEIRDMVTEHKPRAIVHLAAMFSPASYRNPRLARKINVTGTEHIVQAAQALDDAPLLLLASSAAVYGSRNPYKYPELITPDTPTNPIDQYGEDKVLAEGIIRDSGLPYAVLRLAGVISPDGLAGADSGHLVLVRSMPRDNRIHSIDARDVALAFANAVDRADAVDGKVLLIAGDESHRQLNRDLEDDMMTAVGIGRLGPSASLPGDPDDDRGWSFTGWFDTAESQALLEFQRYTWPETVQLMTESQGRLRTVLQVLGPVLRPGMRLALAIQRRVEKRGKYADPWDLIGRKFGPDVLAPTDF